MINKKGFTLIEFIIVMAIIGILVLMAAPKFMDYISEAKISQIQNDMRVIQSVVMADQADAITNDGKSNFISTKEVNDGVWYPVSLLEEDQLISFHKNVIYEMEEDDEGNPKFAEHVNTKLDLDEYKFAANADGEIYIKREEDETLDKLLKRRGVDVESEDEYISHDI